VLTNLTLDVRDGPGLAIVLIIVGILVGRFALWMATPESQLQKEQIGRLRALEAQSAEVHDANSVSFLRRHAKKIRGLINGRAGERAKAELDRLESEISFLRDLDELDEDLSAPGLELDVDALRKKLRDARGLLMKGDDSGAEALRKEVWGAVVDARLKPSQHEPNYHGLARQAGHARALSFEDPGQVGDMLASVSRAVGYEPFDAAARAKFPNLDRACMLTDRLNLSPLAASTEVHGVRKLLTGLDWFLRKVAGMAESADMKVLAVWPFLAVVAFLALALVGFYNFYVSAGATFGAGGIGDYLPLFLWGLSADIARSTLQSLPALKSAA
jgi:hypothetical protein